MEKGFEKKGEDNSIENHQSMANTISDIIRNQKQQLEDKHPTLAKKWTFGEHAADVLASKMGSWGFLILFIIFLLLWISANAVAFIEGWDPYPFIFLNLLLSSIAALQAPIILMSQNRQSQKDRIRMEYDYAVNRKSEREIEEIKMQLERIESQINK